MWIIEGKEPNETQTLAFVDATSLRNAGSLRYPKAALNQTISALESELGSEVRLRSFLFCNTELTDIEWARGLAQDNFEKGRVSSKR